MLVKKIYGLMRIFLLNFEFEGTLGSDCSRLGIKVANSTGDSTGDSGTSLGEIHYTSLGH